VNYYQAVNKKKFYWSLYDFRIPKRPQKRAKCQYVRLKAASLGQI
jgi:hypothetical protein